MHASFCMSTGAQNTVIVFDNCVLLSNNVDVDNDNDNVVNPKVIINRFGI